MNSTKHNFPHEKCVSLPSVKLKKKKNLFILVNYYE